MITTSSPKTDRTVLVCATPSPNADPQVVLADGCYETADERVFWRTSEQAEVLRIPLQAPVSVRPLRHVPDQRTAGQGELRLLAALAAHRHAGRRPPTGRTHVVPEAGHSSVQASFQTSGEDRDQDVLRGRLTTHLQNGHADAAEAAARLLWRRTGLGMVHDTIASCLAELASTWASGQGSVLAERRATTAARTVLERLRDDVQVTTRGRVVLAVPPGDQHSLALTALAHQLHEAGYASLVVDDLPLAELCAVAAEAGTVAVVLSAHVSCPAATAKRMLESLRVAAPHALLAAGGPGLPASLRGADLLTEDPDELLRALAGRTDPLTERERDVLLAVADGLTNSEIADALGVSPATVKTHLDHVYAKTGTEHRAAAVARALRNGWIG